MLNNQAEYRYETPYKDLFVIMQCLTNDTVNLQYVPKNIRYNIRWIKPYKYDINFDDISSNPVIYFCIILNL